jgi:Domain of unknown function (DUF4129)
LQRKVFLAGSCLVGLLLAVAGLMPVASTTTSLPGRIVLDLPAWLGIPFLVLVWLEALFILYLLAPRLQGRKKQAPASTLTQQLVMLAVVTALAIGLRNHTSIGLDAALRSLMEARGGTPPEATAADAPPAVRSAVIEGIVETSLLALAVMALGGLAWFALALLPRRGRGREQPSPFASAELQAAVEDSLDDLRHLPDARLAIIRCYDRFEKVLAGADVRRSPWETVVEFMREALRHPRLPGEAVRELTGLFEIARFSRHELGPSHRERAWQALMAVKIALEEKPLNASIL